MGLNPGIYRHNKKGNLYKLHFVAKHSETLEEFLVYEALYPNANSKYWIRPVKMFSESIELNGRQVPRFERVSD